MNGKYFDKIDVNLGVLPGLTPIHMKFLNGGEITIPAKYGGYVVASGCGSGKTTIIKKIIASDTHRYQGIIYSAATIDECNKMYEYCRELYESRGMLSKLKEDVIVLHSDCKADGTNNDLWRNRPEELVHIPVIICTHHKLLNELPEVLFRYKGFPWSVEDLSPVTRGLAEIHCDMNGENKVAFFPRQLVLIDELPNCSGMKAKIDKFILTNVLGYKRCYPDPSGRRYPDGNLVCLPYYPSMYDRAPGFRNIMGLYETEVPDDRKFIKTNDELNRKKAELLLGAVYDRYYDLCNDPDNVKDVMISYNASSLLVSNPASRILLFDGTGDLTFCNQIDTGRDEFKVLTFPNKYSGVLNTYKIPFKLKRYNKPNSNVNSIRILIEESVDQVEKIIKDGHKVLIVTWMNLKNDGYRITEGTKNIVNNMFNENFNLPGYIKDELNRRNIYDGFEVIHYQSGKDKATNEFREYDSIVFLGEFQVPGYVIKEFNYDYGCSTNLENYTLYQLVQAICRTRIRNHRGESINVYFSEDWNDNTVRKLLDYMSSDKIIVKDRALRFIRPKWRDAINILMNNYPELNRKILMQEPGLIEIDLDDLFKLVPVNRKAIDKYNSLVKYLSTIGITLVITSSRPNRFTRITQN